MALSGHALEMLESTPAWIFSCRAKGSRNIFVLFAIGIFPPSPQLSIMASFAKGREARHRIRSHRYCYSNANGNGFTNVACTRYMHYRGPCRFTRTSILGHFRLGNQILA